MSRENQRPQIEPEERVQQLLARYGAPDVSVAELLCDQHSPNATAYFLVEPDVSYRVMTYGELSESSERIAAALAELGVGQGDRVATLLGKTSEHLITILAIWRLGAVHVPLFTAFARSAIAFRLQRSNAKVVVCDPAQRSKLHAGDDMPAEAPWKIIVTGESEKSTDLSFSDLLAKHEPGIPVARLGGDAPIVEIYTSGTTGRPKGVVASTRMLASTHTYMEYGLDLTPEDVFWNAADPGWAYGLYLGVHGSLCLGVPSVWLSAGFSADATLSVMSRLQVTNFAAAPTVYRALRASQAKVPSDLALRCASSGGEPLTPEVNAWAQHALGIQIHDHYGQTEAGMLITNHHHPAVRKPLREGSMGHAMPGWTGVVLDEDGDEVVPPGTLGRIAFDLTNSPLATFTGYLNEPEKDGDKFSTDRRWYLTGDSGKLDEDGYFHFVSRDDDVIIMAGYRIGPFDVESALLSHPAVVEAAVIAAPDEMRGEVLEAFVVLSDDQSGSAELAEELQQWVKANFAAHAYPRRVHFIDHLPKTPSGKTQRYVLRELRRTELAEADS